MLDFSRSRVGPLLADNPFLKGMMTDTDTTGLKRIGEAHIYFRGMKSTVGMKSVPADMIVLDQDILTVDPQDIMDIVVEQTWLGGKLVYERQ